MSRRLHGALRRLPGTTPDVLNETTLVSALWVRHQTEDRLLSFLADFPRVGAFTLEPISLDFLRSARLFAIDNFGPCGSDGNPIHILTLLMSLNGHFFTLSTPVSPPVTIPTPGNMPLYSLLKKYRTWPLYRLARRSMQF